MSNNVIYSDDPQAIEKLTGKLEACQEQQTYMKAVNAYYRKHGTTKGCPGVSDEKAAKLDARVEAGYSWEKVPYRSYELSGNNAEIRRLKQRIEQLSKDKALGFNDWTFEGGEAVANTEKSRLQLFFKDKPDEAQRAALKRYGFRWAPSEGAWQRLLNENAIYAADRLDFLRPVDGRLPSQHQPKAPRTADKER